MGQEIVYCNGCQTRLLGSDFDKGKAFRVEHQNLCLDCAQKTLAALPPTERDAFAALMKGAEPRKHSTVRIPAVRSTGDSGSHSRLRAASDPTLPRVSQEPRRSPALVLGIIGGVVALILVAVIAASSPPRRPAEPRDTAPPPAPAAKIGDAPLAAEARRLLDQARAYERSNPNDYAGQLDLLQKAVWKAPGSAVAEEIRRDIEAVQARQAIRIGKDLAELDARVKPLLDRGDYGAAIRALEGERARASSQDWTLALKRKIDAAAADARAAAAVLRNQAAQAGNDPAALRALRDRSAALGFPEFLTEFDAAAAAAKSSAPPSAAPPLVLYDDAIAKGWGNNSWKSEIDLASTAIVAEGRCAIAWTPQDRFAGIYLGTRGTVVPIAGCSAVAFRLHRAAERFDVAMTLYSDVKEERPVIKLADHGYPALGAWKEYVIPLPAFPTAKEIHGFALIAPHPAIAPYAYVDDIRFLRGSPGAADTGPPSPTREALTWRGSWLKAAAFAAGRDYPAAQKELEAAQAGLKDADLKSEAARDLADLKAAGALLAEALQALAKWPRGMNVAVDVLDADGVRLRIDEPLRRVEGARLEIRPVRGLLEIEVGAILADSLASIAGAKDPRIAGLLCALEGDLEGARRRLGGEPPAAWLAHAATLTQETEQRRLLLEAAAAWRDPAARVEAAGRYAALLRDHAASPLVRRSRASIAARAEPPTDFFFSTAELKTSGLFHPVRHPKGEIGWTMAEDFADRSRRAENHVEVAYSAAPNAEVRAWVLAGACCLETWSFHIQATDLEGPDPDAPTSIVSAAPGTPALVPVPVTLPFLKRTHASHGGPKAPTRFDWIGLPVLKHPQGGTKKLRVISDQQGFTVVAVLLSPTKRAPPKEPELRELEAGRPPAAGLLDSGASVRTGGILREVWSSIGGDKILDLTGNAAYQAAPASSETLPSFACPRNWNDSYGTRVRGWVQAPATGNYVFWICTDDEGELWLSSDENPARKQKIASQGGASAYGSWTQRPSQQSKEYPLVRGRHYYIEALQKEGGGDDHLLVGWKLPDESLERPIPGRRLVPWSAANAARLGPAGPGLSVPATLPAGTPAAITVDLAGVTATRVEIYSGTQRLGEAKGNPPAFTWTAAPVGVHLLSARVTERGGKTTITPYVQLALGDLFLSRSVDLNGPEGRERGVVTGTGWERSELELRPHADGERAALLRTTVASREGTRIQLSGIPSGKALVYLFATELETAPQAFDIAVNGKNVLSGHRFAAAGDWARLGPWPVDIAGGKLDVAASKGTAHFAGLEVWSLGLPAKPTKQEKTEALGGGGGTGFEQTRGGDPLLAGFKLTKKNNHVKSIQGLWLEGEGTVEGEISGTPEGGVHTELARPGYAVGGLQLRGDDRLRSFRVIYLGITGGRLNPADRYESAWYVGDESGTTLLGGDGAPVVGLHGKRGGDVDRLGLILLR